MNDSNRISRRRFLFAAGTGSAVAATVLVATRKDGLTVHPEKSNMPATGSGYRVTEHVRNYYRTTKV